MEDWGQLLALDAKGILPLIDERPEDFLRRGKLLLSSYSDPLWVAELIKIAVEIISERRPEFRDVHGLAHGRRAEQFKRGVAALGMNIHADLSWVPIIGFSHNEFVDTPSKGGTTLGFSSTILSQEDINLPFMAVNTEPVPMWFSSGYNTGAHEAFHTIRRPLFGPIRLAGAEEFDHLGALIISPIRRLLACERYRRQFRSAWMRLRKAFGKYAAYVLARMSYDSLRENIMTKFMGMNPLQFLKWAGSFEHNLRERIMCHRLGL